MGMIEIFLNAMRLSPDEAEDDYYDDDFMEEEDGNVTRISQRRERKNQDSEEKHSAKDTKKKASNVTPIRQRKTGLNGMEVCASPQDEITASAWRSASLSRIPWKMPVRSQRLC